MLRLWEAVLVINSKERIVKVSQPVHDILCILARRKNWQSLGLSLYLKDCPISCLLGVKPDKVPSGASKYHLGQHHHKIFLCLLRRETLGNLWDSSLLDEVETSRLECEDAESESKMNSSQLFLDPSMATF